MHPLVRGLHRAGRKVAAGLSLTAGARVEERAQRAQCRERLALKPRALILGNEYVRGQIVDFAAADCDALPGAAACGAVL